LSKKDSFGIDSDGLVAGLTEGLKGFNLLKIDSFGA
jgi:hypothetical protein